jgi:hypothetical protein
MQRPYIIYSLSKDRTTQKFNKNKIPDIVQDIDDFLLNCTTTNINEPGSLELTAYTAYDKTEDEGALKKLIDKTLDRFGETNQEPFISNYPSGDFHPVRKYSWEFSCDRLPEVIQYIIDNKPVPKSNFGALELFISYGFNLISAKDKVGFENPEHESMLCIWFSKIKACSPTIYFPFEQADNKFWTYVDGLIPFLPFKLEEKYLRLAHLNKQGEVKSFKKIARPRGTSDIADQ